MKIGTITSINYTELKVRIATEVRGNSVNIAGEVYYFGNIGGYLKTENAVREPIICEVMSISDTDPNKEDRSYDLKSDRELTLKPIGTLARHDGKMKFTLGIGIYPSLYSDVSIVTHEDMQDILSNQEDDAETDAANGEKGEGEVHKSFFLGTSKSLINYPIEINISKFFRIHSAVLGNSGSGKSNTIAHILQEVFEKKGLSAAGAKVILFDTNGEYKEAFKKLSNTTDIDVKFYAPVQSDFTESHDGNTDTDHECQEKGKPDPFYLPHFLLNLDEWCAFLLATEATQRPFWDNVLQENARFSMLARGFEEDFSYYLLDRTCQMINSVLGRAEKDSDRVTSAGGIMDAMQHFVESINFSDNQHKEIIYGALRDFKENIEFDFAKNNDQLKNACDKVQKGIEKGRVNKILNEKHVQGKWFSHKFLRDAAELCLIEEESKGNKNTRNWISTMMTRLDRFLDDRDYEFMRRNFAEPGAESSKETDENRYLRMTFGPGDKSTKQLIVIDVSALPQYALETLTSVLARLIFDYKRNSGVRNKAPIHFILDEAHRYIKRKDKVEADEENIFEKVAREGRKYAIYLLISSQRPSELSETVLSQCGNYIVHRIQNNTDMRYIEGIMPFFSHDTGSKIRQAVEGEAVMFGHCVPMPLQIKVSRAEPAPDSDNCKISKEWFKPPPSSK